MFIVVKILMENKGTLNKKNPFIMFENRAIFSFLFSGVVSSIGSWIYIVGMTALVYKEMGVLGVAFFGLLRQSTYLFFSPVAGYLVDNFSRRKLLLLGLTGNIGSMIFLTLLVKNETDSIYLYSLIILTMVFTASIDYPARLAIAPRLVEDGKLLILNSNSFALTTLAMMIAPLISSAIMSRNSLSILFSINIIIYLTSLLLTFFIPRSVDRGIVNKVIISSEKKYVTTIFRNWKNGFIFIKNHKKVLNANVFLFFNHIVVGSVFVFIPVLSENLDQGDLGIGYLIAINGAGCVIGTLLSSYASEKSWGNIINLSAIGLGVTTILIPFSLSIIGCYLLVLFIGFFSMLGEAPLMTTIQKHIPDEEAGRIYAAVDSIIIGSMGIGSIFIGWLIVHTPFKLAFILIGIIPFIPVIMNVISRRMERNNIPVKVKI